MKQPMIIVLMMLTITLLCISKSFADDCSFGYAQIFDKDWKRIEPYVCLKAYDSELKVWTIKSDNGKARKIYAPSFHIINARGNSYYELIEDNGKIVQIESARKIQ
jgi:hypothetical protein